jgi:TfoX/Sxy family transcriptional regulator of competence genes
MSYDERTVARVRRLLAGRADVVEKRMVGGLSFMVNGRMCCGVTRAGLMVRVGREGRKAALARPHVRLMRFAGRPLAGFVSVEPAGYRTDRSLATWLKGAIAFASQDLAE